jgi:hypothetical protein
VVSAVGAPTSEDFRNFTDEYGMIPYPMLDENQSGYYTMADGYHTVLAVPKTVKDTEFVGIITEALNAETYKTYVPTLYEIALKTRYLRDEESKQILDIILEGRVADFGYIYDSWKGGFNFLGALMEKKSTNAQSYYDSIQRTLNQNLKKIIKAFDALT